MKCNAINLPNAREPESGVLTCGHIPHDCLETIRAAGYRTVVNLCPATEYDDSEESRVARALGLDYVNIPIAGPPDLHDEAIDALDAVLTDPRRRPALIHCASGNRVGALLALHAGRKRGFDVKEALAYGERAGLSSPMLRQAVRFLLESTDRR